MNSSVKVRVICGQTVRWLLMAGLTLALTSALALSAARGEEGTAGIETGSIQRDVIVAPVRRVFPKTPSDRDLNRLSKTVKAKTGRKSKKR